MAARISQAALEKALVAANGVQAAAAELLGCNRSTVCRRIQKSPKLQALVDDILERTLDICENKTLELINGAYWPAIKFMLETKGKHRGYTKTLNLTADKPLPIVFTPGQADMA